MSAEAPRAGALFKKQSPPDKGCKQAFRKTTLPKPRFFAVWAGLFYIERDFSQPLLACLLAVRRRIFYRQRVLPLHLLENGDLMHDMLRPDHQLLTVQQVIVDVVIKAAGAFAESLDILHSA